MLLSKEGCGKTTQLVSHSKKSLATELEQLAHEILSSYPGQDFSSCWVVLPTQRLVVSLLAMLAQARGAIRPPQVLTLEGFLQTCTAAKIFPQAPAEAWLLELSLGALLQSSRYVHLRSGDEHELLQIFSDIQEERKEKEIFAFLENRLKEDVYKEEAQIESLSHRIREIESVYGKLEAYLKSQSLLFPAMYERAQVDHLLSDSFQAPWEQLYLFGFTTFKRFYWDWLLAWSAHPTVRIWLPTPPVGMGGCNPLQELYQFLGWGERLPVIASIHPPIQVHRYPTIFSEVEGALDQVRQYLAAGCPAAKIAVLLPAEGPYAAIVGSVFQASGIPLNLSIPSSMVSTPLGRWISLWIQCLLEPESLSAFYGWCVHPNTQGWLKAKMGGWLSPTFLCGVLESSGSRKELQQWMQENPTRRETEILACLLEDLAEGEAWIYEREGRSLVSWKQFLLARCHEFELESRIRSDVEKSSYEVFQTCLDHFESLSPLVSSRYLFRDFLGLLETQFLGQQTRSVGFPLAGVQVLRLIESRLVPFDVAIVLGCVEGLFPKALPPDRLIPDWMKRMGGLKGWMYIEGLEETTFHLLCTQTPHVILSFPEKCFQQPVTRSRFIEQVLGEKKSLGIEDRHSEKTSDQAGIFCEKLRTQGMLTGPREPLLSQFSAKTVDFLLSCPYRFVLHRLGVKKNWLFVDRDNQVEGLWLHEVFEGFYTGIVKGNSIVEPFSEAVLPSEFHAYVCQRLWTLTEAVAPISLLDTPLKEQLQLYAWPRFASHLAGFFTPTAQGMKPKFPLQETEWSFGTEVQPVSFSMPLRGRDPISISLSGVMDSVGKGPGGYVLTDYKRKRQTVQEGGSWWVPQLLFYATVLAEMGFSFDTGLIGYWSILDGIWDQRGMGKDSPCASSSRRNAIDLKESGEKFRVRWRESVEGLLEPDTAFAPVFSPACTYCEYHLVCKPTRWEWASTI